jgi:hypothetical protein
MVSVVINYCSNERIFLDAVLKATSEFSNDIVVSYGSHLYDGTPEDVQHIDEYKAKFPNVQFVCYHVDDSLDLSKQWGVRNRPTAYWHNLARWTGINAIKDHEWVFLIDADEVPEGKQMKAWLDIVKASYLKEDECYKMATYWYFKSPIFQATTLEDSILLIHYKHLTRNNVFGDYERDHLIPSSRCFLRRGVRGIGGVVLWHHFSWVRSRSCLEHKIKSWAHSNDIFKGVDANEVVNHIFKDENVNDIVHRYQYKVVPNIYNINV